MYVNEELNHGHYYIIFKSFPGLRTVRLRILCQVSGTNNRLRSRNTLRNIKLQSNHAVD